MRHDLEYIDGVVVDAAVRPGVDVIKLFTDVIYERPLNGTGRFKKYKQLPKYKHLLLLRDIWWSKF
jgi:hypothetical protein